MTSSEHNIAYIKHTLSQSGTVFGVPLSDLLAALRSYHADRTPSPKPNGRPPRELSRAKSFLQQFNEPLDTTSILHLSAEAGISLRTLQRAKRDLRIPSRKVHDLTGTYWVWDFPAKTT